jgi:hypothetical protein
MALLSLFCHDAESLVCITKLYAAAFRATGICQDATGRFGWFLLLCGLHFWFLALVDAMIRMAATSDRWR